MTAIRNSLYFVGIDIGSEYSGLAFTSYGNIRSDPMKFSTEIWQGGSLLTLKCPTAILLDNNEEIVAFGYEAETRFSQLLEDDEHHEYYYFKHFRNDFLQVFRFLSFQVLRHALVVIKKYFFTNNSEYKLFVNK